MASIYRRSGSRFWYIDYYCNGHRSQLSLKTANKRVALYKRAQKEQELAKFHPQRAETELPFSMAIAQYLEATRPRKATHTYADEISKAKQLSVYIGQIEIARIAPSHIEDCLNRLSADRLIASVTRNHYRKLLVSFSRWCIFRGYCLDDFTKGIKKIPETEKPLTYLTIEQRDKLLKAARGHYLFSMLMLVLYAGVRWREAATLEWSDVDFSRNVIHIHSKAAWTPKSKRGRVIPLHSKLKQVLEVRRRDTGLCFPTPSSSQGHGSGYKTIARYALRRWLRKIGAYEKGEGWHLLRRTFGCLLAQAGVPILKIASWLGHTSAIPAPTNRYVMLQEGYDADIERML